MTPEEWKLFDSGKTIIEIVQARIDAYSAWLSNGCEGPDPCAHLGTPITYGDVIGRTAPYPLADWTFHGYHYQAWNQNESLWIVQENMPDMAGDGAWRLLFHI